MRDMLTGLVVLGAWFAVLVTGAGLLFWCAAQGHVACQVAVVMIGGTGRDSGVCDD